MGIPMPAFKRVVNGLMDGLKKNDQKVEAEWHEARRQGGHEVHATDGGESKVS